ALLTGIMTVKGVAARSSAEAVHTRPSTGHLVAPNVEAVHHQHFLSFRLDLDVDGPEGNSVFEWNAVPLPPGPGNPEGNGFVMQQTLLGTESEARRKLDSGTGRRWQVTHPSVQNSLGQAVGYSLLPGENALPLSQPGSLFRRRAGFVEAHVWVTPYAQEERYPAGRHPNQSAGGEDGLVAWTRANRRLAEQDVVLWYTLGITHLPRPEDFPVMPVHRAGFKLMPTGFFSRNPALDLP
ncbi:MAG: hypothetical protein FJX77_12985, partial [Armatimonadetes bacterium]|nr:hypothetical protein [Armatimonadota bacterium]